MPLRWFRTLMMPLYSARVTSTRLAGRGRRCRALGIRCREEDRGVGIGMAVSRSLHYVPAIGEESKTPTSMPGPPRETVDGPGRSKRSIFLRLSYHSGLG